MEITWHWNLLETIGVVVIGLAALVVLIRLIAILVFWIIWRH